MASARICPSCGIEITAEVSSCPKCLTTLEPYQPEYSEFPEMLVQRFGEYLLEIKLITSDDLEKALVYQSNEEASRHILLGQALLELGILDRETLDQAITRKLVSLQMALQQANLQLKQRVEQRTHEVERQLVQIKTAAEITQAAISASNLSELLQRTVDLMEERFGYSQVSVYIADETGRLASMREASGKWGKKLIAKGFRVAAGSNSLIGWVLENKQSQVTGDIRINNNQRPDELREDTRSQASLPIIGTGQIIGVLDVQHNTNDAFTPDVISVLQTIANHIAAVIENYHLLETTQNYLNEISALYQASYQMARAETLDEVVRITTSALKQTNHFVVFFMPEQNGLRRVGIHEPGLGRWGKGGKPVAYPDRLAVPVGDLDKLFVPGEAYIVREILSNDVLELPDALIGPLRKAGYTQFALIPSRLRGRLAILFLLAVREAATFSQNTLQSFASLAEITSASLEKVFTSQRMEKRLTALQSLNAISQAVSVETDLIELYKVIHREVISVIGNVNLAIATYNAETDMIEVPYLFDGTEIRSVEHLPVGEGLISILIRTRQPMMLVEDTERKTRELGAITMGKPAKSWLGVPLLIAGEAIGGIILQDLEHEGRFDEDDQRLLTTLASQVAVAIRNARMLDATYRQAARERKLYDITKQIRSEPDIPGIMQMTATELGKLLGAQRTVIELGPVQSGVFKEPSDKKTHHND